MLKNSFSHIYGIGPKIERRLWDQMILDWDTFFLKNEIQISKAKNKIISEELKKSKEALLNNNHNYFSKNLPVNQHWRLFREFKNNVAYIDIETTGLSWGFHIITTIALYDGIKIKYYVNGDNLEQFKTDIQDYDLLITYNGKCFDIPFIEAFFKIKLNHSHIDLRYVLHSLGYKGGLKGCEKQFGLARNDLEEVDGFLAIFLWKEYKKTNNPKALETLLAYNIEDVINLEYLMYAAYNLKLNETPFFNLLKLDIPSRPQNQFNPDLKLINKVRQEVFVSLRMTISLGD